MKQYLFVYGTLSNGKAPTAVKRLMKKLKPIGEGHIHGRLYDLGNYPGAKTSRSSRHLVYGHVLELPDDPVTLQRLDEYEEYSSERPSTCLFIRKKVTVRLKNGKQICSWTYIYNRDVSEKRRIHSGDYATILA